MEHLEHTNGIQTQNIQKHFFTTLSHLSSDHEASFLVSDECVDGSDHPFQLLDGEGHFVVGLSAVLGSVHMDVHLRETSKTLKTVSEI